jgi:hypothetical protein
MDEAKRDSGGKYRASDRFRMVERAPTLDQYRG